MCARCGPSIFGYHITSKTNIDSIRSGGMSHLKTRTGSWTASESGSFAADRREKLPGKIVSTVGSVVLKSMLAGLTEDRILANPLPRLMVPIDVPVTGSTDDNEQLNDEETKAIAMYIAEVSEPASSSAKAKPFLAYNRPPRPTSYQARALAQRLIESAPEHFLVRLGETSAQWASTIEEKITGLHVYFFVSNHNSVLAKYMRLNGGLGGSVLLRVRLAGLHSHEPDGSDANAVMTTSTVLPDKLEMCQPSDELMKSMPPEERSGDNIQLWEKRGVWMRL